MHCFNKLTGAPNGVVLPELVNLYKSPFDLATRKDGAAILTKKLLSKGVLPKDVIFFAPCHVGGIKVKGREEAALASLVAQRFMGEEASSMFGHQEGYDGALDSLVAQRFMGEEASSMFGRQGYEGALDSLVAQRFTGKEALSVFGRQEGYDGALDSLVAQ